MQKNPIEELQAVEIEINHACNLSCSYCPNSIFERKSKGMMTLDFYEKIINELAANGFRGRVSYDFYNEPTLHPMLDKFALLTQRILPSSKVILYSNGDYLNKEKFEKLMESGVSQFVITKHQVHNKQDSRHAFSATYEGLSVQQRKSVVYRGYKDLDLVNRGGLLKELGQQVESLLPCYIPTHILSITVSGKVLSCFEDYEEKIVFGDLNNQKLIDIWNSESYVEFRKNLKKGLRYKYPTCSGCNRVHALPPFDR